jgi:hypothetical protein
VPRLRWFDREPGDQATPIPWAHATVVTATLFLNFPFWIDRGSTLWIPGSLFRNAAFAAVAAALMAGLFVGGPALMCQAAKRPFFDVIKASFGSLPAAAIRLCCAVLLTAWIADLVSFPASRFITFIVRRDVSSGQSTAVAAALVAYLFATGLQSPRINAKLALLSDKLGLAILLAALIRVRHGLPGVFEEHPNNTDYSVAFNAWHCLSRLTLYMGPLILLAAVFGHRLRTRREAALMASMGVALPLFGTVLIVYVISFATYGAGYYRPSLTPNVAMALWSGCPGSAMAPRMMFAIITIFGAVRFGARALMEALHSRILLIVFGAIVVWCSVRPFDLAPAMFEVSAKCLIVVAAVLTADSLAGDRPDRARRIDWIGFCSLAVGLAVGFGWHPLLDGSLTDDWWYPRVLPSYAVAFLTCLAGRFTLRFRLIYRNMI